ncbi:phage minor head protein [Bartonella sp. HY038]|uniref:phage minor head protein n=1 Tax=Bartonella sp. HY038 TaxID=2759660 RepID=UPI0015FA7591|nr:phage minor head protein [Bartonella sp. HY038]
MSSITKRREGGLLGLTAQQASFLANARNELQTGDPKLLKAYLQRERRDKRFDSAVHKAINSGEPLPQDSISRMLIRYEDKLLKLRGDTIGRTEALEALNTSQQEAMEQALDKTQYTEQDVTRVWRCTRDSKTRDSHREMNGQTVKGLTTPFTTPDGYQLKHPGDSSLGAPASETINCRCIQFIRLNYLKGLK